MSENIKKLKIEKHLRSHSNANRFEREFGKLAPSDLNVVEKHWVLKFAEEIAEGYFNKGELIDSPLKTRQYLTPLYRDLHNEVFGVLFLDNRHHVLKFEKELFKGSISSCSVYPRVIAKKCLEYNASAIVCIHNHPSMDPTPSQSDIDITRTIKEVLSKGLEVRVLDHIIIGGNNFTSLAEECLM